VETIAGEMRNGFTASIENLEGKDRLADDGFKDINKIDLKRRGLWDKDWIQCSSGCV
jgi:hypothetical protein